MGYCRACGKEVGESAHYCWNCGTQLERDEASGDSDRDIEKMWDRIDDIIDREIERVEEKLDVPMHSALEERFVFAYQMYIIGLVKGTVETAIVVAADDRDDVNSQELDLSPVYERIVDKVMERADTIEEALTQE